METKIQVFSHAQLGKVRTLTIEGAPWFVGKDVAEALGYADTDQAIRKYVGEEDKQTYPVEMTGQVRRVKIINESGLYSLIMGSKLAQAKEFKRWVTSEVLPSIRQNGIYATPNTIEQMLNNPDFAIRLLQELKASREENTRLHEQVAALMPKADYCDVILDCKEVLTTTAIAKDYGMSARRFNKLLHDCGVQFKSGGVWYPYDEYDRLGWVQSVTKHVIDKGGNSHAYTYTCWTQKGRLGLYNHLKQRGILPLVEQNNCEQNNWSSYFFE